MVEKVKELGAELHLMRLEKRTIARVCVGPGSIGFCPATAFGRDTGDCQRRLEIPFLSRSRPILPPASFQSTLPDSLRMSKLRLVLFSNSEKRTAFDLMMCSITRVEQLPTCSRITFGGGPQAMLRFPKSLSLVRNVKLIRPRLLPNDLIGRATQSNQSDMR